MKNLFLKFIGSFDTITENGFSGRKLTAVAGMTCVIYLHYIVDLSGMLALYFLIADMCLVLLCLGLVTFEQIIKLKNEINKKD